MFTVQSLAMAGLHVVVEATSMLLLPVSSQAEMCAPRAGLVCIIGVEGNAYLLVGQQHFGVGSCASEWEVLRTTVKLAPQRNVSVHELCISSQRAVSDLCEVATWLTQGWPQGEDYVSPVGHVCMGSAQGNGPPADRAKVRQCVRTAGVLTSCMMAGG